MCRISGMDILLQDELSGPWGRPTAKPIDHALVDLCGPFGRELKFNCEPSLTLECGRGWVAKQNKVQISRNATRL